MFTKKAGEVVVEDAFVATGFGGHGCHGASLSLWEGVGVVAMGVRERLLWGKGVVGKAGYSRGQREEEGGLRWGGQGRRRLAKLVPAPAHDCPIWTQTA